MTDLEFDGRLTDNSGGRFALAMDSLALYTDAGYKLSAGIAIVMMFLALAELAYTLIIFCAGHPIEGWTTMMFVLTLLCRAVCCADHHHQISFAAGGPGVQKAELPDREHRENPKVNPAQAGKGGSHRIDAAI